MNTARYVRPQGILLLASRLLAHSCSGWLADGKATKVSAMMDGAAPLAAPVAAPLQRPRGSRAIAFGASSTTLGLILSLWGDPQVGAVCTICGVLLSVFGLHRLGRSGPDPDAITARRYEHP